MEKELTQEEKSVLVMLGFGHSDKRICRNLDITQNRLCEIKKSYKIKLGVKNCRQAILVALNKRLLTIHYKKF